MSASSFPTTQYTAEQYVESAGGILCDLATKQICILEYPEKGEFLLPKGRRNIGENRRDAALREIFEETGFAARLLPVCMRTRAPPSDADADCADEVSWRENLVEPFMVTQRQLAVDQVKFIWWYLAAVDKDRPRGPGEVQFRPVFVDFGEAERRLTFETDCVVLRRAASILKDSGFAES